MEGEGIKTDEEMDLQNCKTSFFFKFGGKNKIRVVGKFEST